jgi:hypothetical protein
MPGPTSSATHAPTRARHSKRPAELIIFAFFGQMCASSSRAAITSRSNANCYVGFGRISRADEVSQAVHASMAGACI